MSTTEIKEKVLSLLGYSRQLLYLLDSMTALSAGSKYENEIYITKSDDSFCIFLTKENKYLWSKYKTDDADEVICVILYFILEYYKKDTIYNEFFSANYSDYIKYVEEHEESETKEFEKNLPLKYQKYLNGENNIYDKFSAVVDSEEYKHWLSA